MTTRERLTEGAAETVEILIAKAQETTILGRPADTVDYTESLANAARAFDLLDCDTSEDYTP